MQCHKGIDRLQLQNHFSLYNDIRPKTFIELQTVVLDRNPHLPFNF